VCTGIVLRKAGALEAVSIVLAVQLVLLLPSPTVKARIPEPYELYGTAHDEAGVVLFDGEPIRTFIDGVEYSNKTSVYSRPGYFDGYFDVDTYGNYRSNRTVPGTPWIKEGGDEGDDVMYAWGEMTNNTPIGGATKPWKQGVVFKENHTWQTGLPPEAGDLNAAPDALQPPPVKIYSIVTNSTINPYTDNLWLCNPTPLPVEASTLYIQKDVPGSYMGPIVQIPSGTIEPFRHYYVNTGSLNYFVETGDAVKLVWKNNASNPQAPYGGKDIILDRVEFNKTPTGGTLNWETGNTIMINEPAPDRGFQINRSAACRDTNSAQRDFFLNMEIIEDIWPPDPPDPVCIQGLCNWDLGNPALNHITILDNFRINWTHRDPQGDPQVAASVYISTQPDGGLKVWTGSTGSAQELTYNGLTLPKCTDFWLGVSTKDTLRYGDVTELKFHTNCPPASPTKVWPLVGAIVPAGMQTVWWSEVIDSDPGDRINYTWVVDDSPVFSPPYASNGTTTSNHSDAFMTNPTMTYYWCVDASDGWSYTNCTGSWFFKTSGNPLASISVPTGIEDWTGGSNHYIICSLSDDLDLRLAVEVNYSLDGGNDGYPYQAFAGSEDVGPINHQWTLPVVDSKAVRLRITATDGTNLSAVAYSASFEIDSTAPTILTTVPANNSSGVTITDDVQVVFDEPVNKTSAEQAFSISPDPGDIQFDWTVTGQGKDVLVVSHEPFNSETEYIVSFSPVLRDISDPGNHPSISIMFNFTTKPPVVIQPPVAKAVGKNQILVGEEVTFYGNESIGNITRYVWTITDNQNHIVEVLTGVIVNYTFDQQGRYSITLTVHDDTTGLSDSDTMEIVVTSNVKGGPDLTWLIVLIAILLACAFIGATEIGRVALLTLLVAPMHGRRTKDKDEAETRGMIRGFILGNPGECYTSIKQNLGLKNGTLSWHLMKLEKEGIIKSRVQGTRRRYYPKGAAIPAENGGELREIEQRLLKAVEEGVGRSVKELAEELGVSSQLALYHIRRLSQKGFVTLERKGLRLRVYLHPENRNT
jgi:DNA-binding transcriptional ArsR family regulator